MLAFFPFKKTALSRCHNLQTTRRQHATSPKLLPPTHPQPPHPQHRQPQNQNIRNHPHNAVAYKHAVLLKTRPARLGQPEFADRPARKGHDERDGRVIDE